MRCPFAFGFRQNMVQKKLSKTPVSLLKASIMWIT